MEALFALHAEGKLKPRITHRYSLEEVPDALRAMERREIKGKVIITP
jgi:NADPH2:quinone reductase